MKSLYVFAFFRNFYSVPIELVSAERMILISSSEHAHLVVGLKRDALETILVLAVSSSPKNAHMIQGKRRGPNTKVSFH